jgi:hypothetical protein
MKNLNTIDLKALKTVTGGATSWGSWSNNWAAKSTATAATAPSTSWSSGSWNWGR